MKHTNNKLAQVHRAGKLKQTFYQNIKLKFEEVQKQNNGVQE